VPHLRHATDAALPREDEQAVVLDEDREIFVCLRKPETLYP
jgi:hypothetical protein